MASKANSKISNFKDFIQDPKAELDELKKIKRSFTKNELEGGLKQHKSKFNKITRKNDDVTEDDIDDEIESLEENTSDEFDNERHDIEEIYVHHTNHGQQFLKIVTKSGRKYRINLESDYD